MTARLLACPVCARHVRVNENRCPFCDLALPEDFGAGPAPVPPPRGLSRAEIFRFAARAAAGLVGSGLVLANVGMVAGCSGSGSNSPDAANDGTSTADAARDGPHDADFLGGEKYGSAPFLDAGSDALHDTGSDALPDGEPGDAPPDVSAPGDAHEGG
jgi:hypothetical protein